MKKFILVLLALPTISFADDDLSLWNLLLDVQNLSVPVTKPQTVNANSYYISNSASIQNPYAGQPSGGGTLTANAAQKTDGFWSTLFTDGTYNIYSGATTSTGSYGQTQTGTFNGTSAYGVNVFAQTGHVGGFALGGGATIMNPFFASQINGANVNSSLLTPTNQQIALTQAYLEYQYSNIVNADIGYIGINNSPWLTGSYFADSVNVPITYQGALINVNPSSGWLLTALAFNGIQTSGQNGFTGETLFDKQFGTTRLSRDKPSNGTAALGSDFKAFNNNYDLRLWAYHFDNYGTLLYGDNSLNLPINDTVKFNFAAQGGVNNNYGSKDAYTVDVDILDYDIRKAGTINSNFIGGQVGMTIDWVNLTFSADTIWGPSSAIGNGAIISPYTVGYGADPLYTEGFLTNLVNQALTGNSYKAAATFTFLDNNLSVGPNYLTLENADPKWNGTQEAFLTVNYTIPQVKGLHVYGAYAYQWLPDLNPSDNQWTAQAVASYMW